MAKAIHKLTAKKIESLKKPGWHSDGGGLYLRVRPDGSKRWIYLWMREGKRREMFLGRNPEYTIEQIREMAATARELIARGNDPLALRKTAAIEAREAQEAVAAAEAEGTDVTPTFGTFAEEYISTHEEGWKNEKHRWQWRNSITNHCKLIVEKPVNEVTTDDVLDVLRPIWTTIPDTAGRVRGRIETILDAAKAGNHIESPWENPARWKGNLIHRLPKRKKLSTGHYTAIAYEEMPDFFKAC
ncbi:site-specific integrase [Sphingobium amiense]|uniref:Site-specific integrase n=2 Tax=Sphingobium amiense TaxID=135719 RepID=A0A494VXA3_9SPHN|nr:Arm DNA-binding domain-containing protein [Sphingobium amiense]BBD97034.1 site-specific integrase [Sphingobium amiense]